jgi:hypothetical protein
VRERLKQHALIVSVGGSRREFSFDHDSFREFFLGEQLGWHLVRQSVSDVRKIMRIDLLRAWTYDMAVASISSAGGNARAILEQLIGMAQAEGPSSYVRENAGGIAIRLLEQVPEHIFVHDLVFSNDAFQGRCFKNVTFERCYFRPTSLLSTGMLNCRFENCEFERLDIEKNTTITQCVIGPKSVVASLGSIKSGEQISVYAPDMIRGMLVRVGFVFAGEEQPELPLTAEPEIDRKLAMFEKAVQAFQRATFVHAGTFRLRLSIHATEFFDTVLEDMVRCGILQPETHGPGAGDRYRLGVPLAVIANAMAESRGSYERCLELIRARRR